MNTETIKILTEIMFSSYELAEIVDWNTTLDKILDGKLKKDEINLRVDKIRCETGYIIVPCIGKIEVPEMKPFSNIKAITTTKKGDEFFVAVSYADDLEG